MHPLVIVGGLTVLGKIFQERTLPWAGKPRGWAVKKPFGYSYAEEAKVGRHKGRVGKMYSDTEPIVHAFAQEMADHAEEYGEGHGYTKRQCAAIFLHTYRNLGGYRREQIKDCQRDLGLPETGVYDPYTIDSMGVTLGDALRERAYHQRELEEQTSRASAQR
jgi:hypothetical protein